MPPLPVESLSFPARDKVITAAEAVQLIRDGDAVTISGFGGAVFPEELVLALEEPFLTTGTPRDLTLVFTVAHSNGKGRGVDHLCHEGLLRRAIGGHLGNVGGAAADGRRGQDRGLQPPPRGSSPNCVGLGTFVDPRLGGGKVNERTTEDRVRLMEIDGQEYLFYKALPLNVAMLRGTTADPDGNITMEREDRRPARSPLADLSQHVLSRPERRTAGAMGFDTAAGARPP